MIKVMLFDFDGVILDSMKVRDDGFRSIFKEYPSDLVEEFIKYHRYNGGLSRYVKIRYFYEKMLGKTISDEEVKRLAEVFSVIMRAKLTDPQNLIPDTISFIKEVYQKFTCHIVSGSDQEELRFLCKSLGVAHYFKTINGSPVPKIQLVKNVLEDFFYIPQDCVLIGDSINDFEAAKENKIGFIGYNNPELRNLGEKYFDVLEGEQWFYR